MIVRMDAAKQTEDTEGETEAEAAAQNSARLEPFCILHSSFFISAV
jgi:hypothetical protein